MASSKGKVGEGLRRPAKPSASLPLAYNHLRYIHSQACTHVPPITQKQSAIKWQGSAVHLNQLQFIQSRKEKCWVWGSGGNGRKLQLPPQRANLITVVIWGVLAESHQLEHLWMWWHFGGSVVFGTAREHLPALNGKVRASGIFRKMFAR